MEILWLIIMGVAILSRIAESSKKQAQKRAQQQRQIRPTDQRVVGPQDKIMRTDQEQPRLAPRPGARPGTARPQPESLQDLIALFTGDHQSFDQRKTPQVVRRQEVLEDEWKENLEVGRESFPDQMQDTKPRDASDRDGTERDDLTEMDDIDGIGDLAHSELGGSGETVSVTDVQWNLQEAAKGVIWHEILDGPRSRSGKRPEYLR